MTMPELPQSQASFSPRRRWGIGFNVGLVTLVVLAIVVMVNYLSRDHFLRFHLSAFGRIPLAPRTVHFLQVLTNQVDITIYYDKDDSMYSLVSDLLSEYKLANRNLHIQTVDYLRDAALAVQLKEKYHFLAAPNAKNFIIFDCAGRVKAVDGNSLAKYILDQVPNAKEREFRRRPVAFEGERAFTATLMAVTNPKPFNAYFLEGDGEHSIASDDDALGYLKFATTLQQDYIHPEKLSLGTNAVPDDCNLLVIAGPTDRIPDLALEKIERYLNQGGRLLALFDVRSFQKATGLEDVLVKWGVSVTTNVIKDPDNTTQSDLMDMKVGSFSRHPVVNPLQGLQLHLILPRSIGVLPPNGPAADAPMVEALALSGARSFAEHAPQLGHRPFPLMVAVEKGSIKGVVTERGTTRIVAAGDSIFLGNHYIDSAANRDFARYAVNWLLDRPQLLEGLPPRPINEYRLALTRSQQQSAEWLLLGGMPATALSIGAVVWLRRRR
jgi:hypothetical protein